MTGPDATNAAFAKLPEGTVETLTQPENKQKLSDILTYYVISGKTDRAALVEAINVNGGAYAITTVNGAALTAKLDVEDVVHH